MASPAPTDTMTMTPYPRGNPIAMSTRKESTTRKIESLPAFGVWVPPLTPVDRNLAPDHPRLIEHLRWLLAAGCHGLALFGTTSEANSFSVGERTAVLELALESGIAPERMMVGTGCCALPDSVRLTRHAADLGCKKVLMLPPFYYKGVSDEGLFDYFARVIDEVSDPALRIVLYHFPRMSAVPITVGLIERLLRRFPDTVIGVKDSSGDWNNSVALRERFPHLAIFPGSERFLLDGLEIGGAGCLTATANANPAAIRAVFDAWRGEASDARSRQDDITSIRNVFDQHPMIPVLKHVVAHYRRDSGWRRVRPPLVSFDESKGAQAIAALEAEGFTLEPETATASA